MRSSEGLGLAVVIQHYLASYHDWRTHLALAKDSPIPRVVQPPTSGVVIVQLPHLGGLHYHCERRVA